MHVYRPEEDFNDEFSYECFQCDQKRKALYSAADYLEEVVKRLYITDQTDILKIQIALDNLCTCLGVKTFDGDINIEAKKPEYLLEDWVEQNNAYLRSFAINKTTKE